MTPEKAAPIPALLPCPFCGGRAETWVLEHPGIQSGEDGQYQGGCAVACAESPWCDTLEEVATWWNRRADREARPSLPDSREDGQGFVQLPDGWLAIELRAVEEELAKWPAGLRTSFESVFPVRARAHQGGNDRSSSDEAHHGE